LSDGRVATQAVRSMAIPITASRLISLPIS
jgi:hypothetical protein